MECFVWKDNLTVGIPEIDGEHRMLIECLNQISDAMTAGADRGLLLPLLSRLIAHTEDHFLHEEIIWESARYLDLDQHKEQHANLLRTVREFRDKYASGRISMSPDVMNALRGWVENHIFVSDKEAAATILGASSAKPDLGSDSSQAH